MLVPVSPVFPETAPSKIAQIVVVNIPVKMPALLAFLTRPDKSRENKPVNKNPLGNPIQAQLYRQILVRSTMTVTAPTLAPRSQQ
jgi:hypothetical protein